MCYVLLSQIDPDIPWNVVFTTVPGASMIILMVVLWQKFGVPQIETARRHAVETLPIMLAIAKAQVESSASLSEAAKWNQETASINLRVASKLDKTVRRFAVEPKSGV